MWQDEVSRHTCECRVAKSELDEEAVLPERLTFSNSNDVTMVIALLLIREPCHLKWHKILAINWPYVIHGTCRLMCVTYTYTHKRADWPGRETTPARLVKVHQVFFGCCGCFTCKKQHEVPFLDPSLLACSFSSCFSAVIASLWINYVAIRSKLRLSANL